MLFENDININKILYSDLPVETFAQRIKKSKLIAGLNQEQLANKTGLSRATVNELEAGYRDTITKDTLLKLLQVLDPEILLDDYYNFILNQRAQITLLINKFGITDLTKMLSSHHSTIYGWRDEKNTISKAKYTIIKNIDQD